jgi:hypothetical protein
MASSKGKTVGLILLVLLLIFFFGSSPFYLAPFGIFSSITRTVKQVIDNGLCAWNGNIFHFPFRSLFTFLFFFIWIFVIVWVYRDAERRGMNGMLWALLVLIGNLIGLIIYLIIRSETIQKPTRESSASTCSHCGKPVTGNFTFCPHCGKSLKTLCPKCKEEIQEGWKACPHCGAKLPSKP